MPSGSVHMVPTLGAKRVREITIRDVDHFLKSKLTKRSSSRGWSPPEPPNCDYGHSPIRAEHGAAFSRTTKHEPAFRRHIGLDDVQEPLHEVLKRFGFGVGIEPQSEQTLFFSGLVPGFPLRLRRPFALLP